jgi:hypothetical protein
MLWLAVLVKVGLGASKLLVEEAMMMDEAKKVVVKDLSEKPGLQEVRPVVKAWWRMKVLLMGLLDVNQEVKLLLHLLKQNTMAVKLSVGSFRA